MLAQPFVLPPLGLQIIPAFGLVPNYSVWPHFDLGWVRRGFSWLTNLLLGSDASALGIDENTGLVGRLGEKWQVMGAGGVTVITTQGAMRHASGSRLLFNRLYRK